MKEILPLVENTRKLSGCFLQVFSSVPGSKVMPVGHAQEYPSGVRKQRWEHPPLFDPHAFCSI